MIIYSHSNIEETVEAVYTKEEVLQYITFARKFKPIIGREAADLLVHHYNHLRLRDTTTTGKSTWRITVRQLESMIRLAEAMARLEICDEVQPKHVKEAYRLLNKSIIRVEQPDIHLDSDDEDETETAMETETNEPEENTENAVNGVQKKKLILSFEEYRTLGNMIAVHLRREEARMEEGAY